MIRPRGGSPPLTPRGYLGKEENKVSFYFFQISSGVNWPQAKRGASPPIFCEQGPKRAG